ncbi:hypothetical protein D3C81_2004200 [compost metagenome]
MASNAGGLLKQRHCRIILVHNSNFFGLHRTGGRQALGLVLSRFFLTLHILGNLAGFSHFMLVFRPGRVGEIDDCD